MLFGVQGLGSECWVRVKDLGVRAQDSGYQNMDM